MSHARRQKQQQKKKDPAAEDCAKGVQLVWANPALAAMEVKLCREEECRVAPRQGLVRVSSNGRVHLSHTRHAEPAEWAWAIAHALIHLGFGHVPAATGERPQPDRYDLAARCVVVNRFLATFPVGRTPDHLPPTYPDGDEERIAAAWRREGGIPAAYEHCGTAGAEPDQLLVPWDGYNGQAPDWQLAFAHALTRTMSTALDLAGGRRDDMLGGPTRLHPWQQALSWFVSSYPLLGGIAAGITLVADAELARAHGISVAAVDAEAGEIYVNPLRRYDDEEWRFILAHEMLHAALRHGDRRGTRDPYLFNVACDYVINGWLVEMRVGTMPRACCTTRPSPACPPRRSTTASPATCAACAACPPCAARASATSSAARSARPRPRRPRRLLPARPRPGPRPAPAAGTRLPARRPGRGDPRPQPPAAALGRPPRPLVRRVRAPPRARTLVRAPLPAPGRHPGHPARRTVLPAEEIARCTFGVVLDTSGSMDRTLLGKALGAIASYAEARDVPAARVVFCDAAPHDAGYLPVTEIAGRVRVHGRGGTVLQPGVDLLLRADDFPPTAPVLVITDGWCDVLRVRREHAYLIPKGARLPFTARGPVFRVS